MANKPSEMQGDSATFTLVDANGFDVLYTVREKDGEEHFADRVKSTSQMLKIDGYTPKPKFTKSFGTPSTVSMPPQTTNEKCRSCGGEMLISKKSGKPYCKALCWKEKTY